MCGGRDCVARGSSSRALSGDDSAVCRKWEEKNGGKKEQERVDAKAEEWVKAVAVMK